MDQLFDFVTISSTAVLFVAGSAFFLLNTIGKPFLKILWLPINIITLGLFSWVLNIIVVLIVLALVPGFSLNPFHFPAIEIGKILIPAIKLTQFWTYFAFSFMLSWFVAFLGWLLVGE